MNLSIEQIERIATGVTYADLNDEGRIVLHRFSKAEEEIYEQIKPNFYSKVFCTSGVKLAFKTDSRTFSMKGFTKGGTTRNYMSVEAYKNGAFVDSFNNYGHLEIPRLYSTLACPIGEFELSFDLGEGEGLVEIYLPWSVQLEITSVSIDDGASLEPVKRDKLLLAYGDSITQGYDALVSYNRYSARLAEALGADEHNKAIGGEIFFPKLGDAADTSLKPDYITVAYGTNDWNGRQDTELFKVHVKEFFGAIRKAYPGVPMFALMPIWRKEADEGEKPLGSLEGLADKIAELVADIPDLYVIKGYDVVPHSEDYFADLHLHPNDAGYGYQAKGFAERIKKLL